MNTKNTLVMIMGIVMLVAFAGCPRAPHDPGASGDGQFVPPVVPPVVLPEPEVQQGLLFQGSLSDDDVDKAVEKLAAKSAEKMAKAAKKKGEKAYANIPNASLIAMGDAFKAKAAMLRLEVCENDGYGKDGKGGGYSNCAGHDFLLVNGEWHGFVPLNPGNYWVRAQLIDKEGYPLFEASTWATVNQGCNTKVGLRFDFLDYYQFYLGVYNLPEIGLQGSGVRILEYSTDTEYYGYGYRDEFHWIMYFNLPLDFIGGSMYFVDQSGTPINGPDGQPLTWNLSLIPWQINWPYFDFSDEYLLAYQPAASGTLTADVSFAYEERYIRVGGIEFNDIGEAVKLSSSPMTIELGPGDYLGFWANGADSAKDVRIVGSGANMTRLVRDDNDGAIIVMDPTVKAAKGGGYRLILESLAVSAYSSTTAWPPSAIQLWDCGFEAYNCYFENSSAPTISLTDQLQVLVDHCWFQNGGAPAIWLNYYDPTQVRVQNSIFTGWQFEAVYLGTYYESGADGMAITNCCFSGGVPTGPEFVQTTNPIFVDPMLDWQTKLPLPGSPCIGAANDGTNIGLMWTE